MCYASYEQNQVPFYIEWQMNLLPVAQKLLAKADHWKKFSIIKD